MTPASFDYLKRHGVANRLGLMRARTTLPDFVSVNFDEDGANEVAGLLLERGIGVEAGLNGSIAARRFAAYSQNR